jgi:PAS domain S-box-containing protein
MIDQQQIIREISVLYELSLAAGNSLDLATNCDIFVRTLLSRKNLSFAGIWIKNEYLTGIRDGGATLVYANPKFRVQEPTLAPDHPIWSLIAADGVASVSSQDPAFRNLITESGIATGTAALFALGDIGILKLVATTRTEPFNERSLNQLGQVLAKFTVSLTGCLAHRRLIREESTRRRDAEEALGASEALYRTIFEATGEAMAIIDETMAIALVNREMERLFGYGCLELAGRDWTGFIHEHEIESPYHNEPETAPMHIFGRTIREIRIRDRAGAIMDVILTMTRIPGTGRLVASFNDITARKRVETDLRIKEYALASSINGIVICDLDRKITYTNATARTMWGYADTSGMLRATVSSLFHRQRGEPANARIFDDIIVKGGWFGELTAERKDGSLFDVQFSATLVKGTDERPLCILCSFVDITEQKKLEKALRVSETKFRELADALPQIVFELDATGRLIFINRFGAGMLGYSGERPLGEILPEDIAAPEDIARTKAFFSQVFETGTGSVAEFTILTGPGRPIPVLAHATPVLSGGKVIGIRGIATDISERKESEEQIRRSLEEKEILLREVHHRVKNNLQVISALISLQSDSLSDPADRDVLREAEKRITSIALVHEKLYRSRDLARVDFDGYLLQLLEHLAGVYLAASSPVRILYEGSANDFTIDEAIPCGLIITEAVSNAMKYAFPDGREGTISITVAEEADGECGITIRDDGVGFPPGFDPDATGSLGLHLIRMLATRQLRGTLAMTDEKGITIYMQFRRTDLPARGDR